MEVLSKRFMENDVGNLRGRPELDNRCFNSIVELIRCAVFIVDDAQRVLWSNPSADALLQKGDLLSVSNGRLRACGANQSAKLHAFLDEVLIDRPTRADASVLCLGRRGSRQPCEVMAFSIGRRAAGPDDVDGQRTIAVFVADSEHPPTIPASTLRILFGLTSSELRLVRFLLEGHNFADYASTAGISRNTARTHLKSIFRKTGSCSQITLVTTLLRFVLPVQLDEDPNSAP